MSTNMPEGRWKQVGSQVKVYYTQQNAEAQSIRWMRKHGDEPGDSVTAFRAAPAVHDECLGVKP